ncbi:hypothetical protein ACN5LO_001796 [Cronobacter sakazakii]
MNELSKERLAEITSGDSSRLITVSEALAMARELLALRERAEPVAWLVCGSKTFKDRTASTREVAEQAVKDRKGGSCIKPLYTAPPAPVVPDERYQQLSELYHAQEKRLFKLAQRIKGPAFDKYAYSPSQAIDVLEVAIFGENEEACRAAMLKGAEPVRQHCTLHEGLAAIRNSGIAIDANKIQAERDALNALDVPDGWVLVPKRPTREMLQQIHPIAETTCPDCGNLVTVECEDNVLMSWDDMLAAPPAPGKEG